MAIALEFLNFVVPISAILNKYPGGWEKCLKDHEGLIGETVWFDEYLWRDGAMNSGDIRSIVQRWEELGFKSRKTIRGLPVCDDYCVVQAPFGVTTLPCDWLVVSGDGHSAHLKGVDRGELIGRHRRSTDEIVLTPVD